MTFWRSTRHPSPVELSRALSEGADRKLEEHLQRCEGCAATWADWTRVDALAMRRTAPVVPSDRSARVLAAVLDETRGADQSARASARRERPLWWWGSLAGAAAAAAVAIVIGLGGRSAPPLPQEPAAIAYRGTVRAHEGARFDRVSGLPDEVVRLYEGTISVDVDPLGEGERFRIVVGDGEVEVRGTSFDVEAKGDALSAVEVDHGVVDVKPRSLPAVVLLDGQRWDARTEEGADGQEEAAPPRPAKERPARAEPPAIPAPAPAPTTKPAPVPTPVQAPEAKPSPSLPMAELFDRGWSQLRAGRFEEAARTFEEALAKYPSDPLAEDASFWRGVSLARSKRPQEASRALAAFIDAHPSSHRAGEASVMLGWILLERKELDAAEARFHAAASDPVEKVRSSADKGLEAVRATRRNEAAPR